MGDLRGFERERVHCRPVEFRIRKISSSGSVSTVAGNGIFSDSGDGGPATKAQLNGPQGAAVDGAGNLYVADTQNNVVRQISPNGTIAVFAGNGSAGSGGDGGPANQAATEQARRA